MSFSASYKEYILKFNFPAGTSRGVLLEKKSYFITLKLENNTGVGECSVIPGLSVDSRPDYDEKIKSICEQINRGADFRELDLVDFPSISFGLETALLDIKANGSKILFPGPFTEGEEGISINGLVWMGDKASMEKQVRQKIDMGFRCIKLKIGAIDFDAELQIISDIRRNYSVKDLEIRLDANGAFEVDTALEKLKRLSDYHIHSVEQPIKAGQWLDMAAICAVSPIPVALDEELLGVNTEDKKAQLLSVIQPDYIILKPGLLGGIEKAQDWIYHAQKHRIGWWVTSALEANIGLNAIAQWTATLKTTMPQGLGTGQIYSNNIPSPLEISKDRLFYIPSSTWDLEKILP